LLYFFFQSRSSFSINSLLVIFSNFTKFNKIENNMSLITFYFKPVNEKIYWINTQFSTNLVRSDLLSIHIIYIGLYARNAMTFCPHIFSFFFVTKLLRNFALSSRDAPLATLFDRIRFKLILLDLYGTVFKISGETRWRQRTKNLRVRLFFFVFLRINYIIAKLFSHRLIENTLVYQMKKNNSQRKFLLRMIFVSHWRNAMTKSEK